MEKILLAIDPRNIETKSLDFACYLSRLTKSKITGVFLENLMQVSPPDREQKNEMTELSIQVFKDACISREVCCNVHRDREFPAKALIKESRYADIVVTGADISFSKQNEGLLTEFVVDILKKAECAVVIAPEKFKTIDEIVFAYDGSAAAAFAIKQFTYLLPEFYDRKASIVQVNKNGKWEDPGKYKFKEWLKDHYTHLEFEAHKGESRSGLFDCIFKKKNSFIVMGAYGRNPFSQFFKPSHAHFLIKTIDQPIFIAHL